MKKLEWPKDFKNRKNVLPRGIEVKKGDEPTLIFTGGLIELLELDMTEKRGARIIYEAGSEKTQIIFKGVHGWDNKAKIVRAKTMKFRELNL